MQFNRKDFRCRLFSYQKCFNCNDCFSVWDWLALLPHQQRQEDTDRLHPQRSALCHREVSHLTEWAERDTVSHLCLSHRMFPPISLAPVVITRASDNMLSTSFICLVFVFWRRAASAAFLVLSLYEHSNSKLVFAKVFHMTLLHLYVKFE